MSLATRCTACGTAFRVVQDQLKVSEGWVRCGQCREVFNALEQLFDLERDGIPATAAEVPAGDVRHALPATVRAPARAQPNEAPAPDDAVPEPPVEVAGLEVEELDVADADPPPEIAALDASPADARHAVPPASALLAFSSVEEDDSPLLPGLGHSPPAERTGVPSLYAALDESEPVPQAAAFLAPELDADADDTIRLPDVPRSEPPLPASVRDPDVAVDEWAVAAAHERPRKDAEGHRSGKRRHARRQAPVVHMSARDQIDFSDARFDSDLLADDALEAAAPAVAEPAVEDLDHTAPIATPEFLRRAERQARWRRPAVRAALAVTSVVLGALLALQAANHFRDDLAARWPATKPALVAWCRVAACTLEAPRRLDDITVENTALARASADAFRLAVTLRNRGAVALALPAVDLSLTDASGRLVARRALTARDFNVAPEVLPPNAELALQAPISTGNARVSGYTVEIFYP
jgi:predicted Zn finger-like uncharacterized protein